jgi:hypothetical protein
MKRDEAHHLNITCNRSMNMGLGRNETGYIGHTIAISSLLSE